MSTFSSENYCGILIITRRNKIQNHAKTFITRTNDPSCCRRVRFWIRISSPQGTFAEYSPWVLSCFNSLRVRNSERRKHISSFVTTAFNCFPETGRTSNFPGFHIKARSLVYSGYMFYLCSPSFPSSLSIFSCRYCISVFLILKKDFA